MLNTAIGVQFKVNDLQSKYEVVGTSDNYSFNYELGKGSDLVDFEGDTAQKSVGLRGNYGDFAVRVFAISDIGVRSAFIQSGISVSPPEFDGTFSFADIEISSLPEDALVGREIEFTPTDQENLLAVDSEYTERSVDIQWKLFPPVGHAKEGSALGNELLSDSLLSHFSLQIRNTENGDIISQSQLNNPSHQGLQSLLNTSDVGGVMQQYTGFSFQMSELVFDELNLNRTLSLEVVSHDAFGKTSTGIITGHNYVPRIEDLSYSLHGSKVGFAWSYSDTDFENVNFRSISIPSDQEIYNPRDFDASLDYYNDLNSAIRWSKKVPSWQEGQYCRYEGNIYECKVAYNRMDQLSAKPSTSTSLWSLVLSNFDFDYNEETTISNNLSFDHFWGRKYYYCATPVDGYGEGPKYNVVEDGVEIETEALSDLHGFVSEVKIDNLNFIEREDDLIFRWSITDQDNNLVDLNQYKFLVSANDSPEVLGISGSLFDSDTNLFLTGITEGLNSRSSITDENGDVVIVDDLPGTKVFESFEYTREINNQLYSTGGFPSSAQNFSRGNSYGVGDQVIFENTLFSSKDTVPKTVLPGYEQWSHSGTYVYGSATDLSLNSLVDYNDEIYVTNGSSPGQLIGAEADNVVGVFDFDKTYSVGDMVIAPVNPDIEKYDSSSNYIKGDYVIYSNSAGSYIYHCIEDNGPLSSVVSPGSSLSHWFAVEIFEEIDCQIYKALQASTNKSPSINSSEWQIQTPETSSEYTKLYEKYSLAVDNWSASQFYVAGDFVLYGNDIFRAKLDNGRYSPEVPSSSSAYWDEKGEGGYDIFTTDQAGDLRYYNGAVYKCLQNNPDASPIDNFLGAGDLIQSNYSDSHWLPFWEENTGYDDIPFGHVGIPESGKRSVGIELGILAPDGSILSSRSLVGFNLEPSILANGFKVDSLKKVTSTEFNFRYANEAREKVTKLQMYRSSDPDFSILDADGLPGAGSDNFISEILGGADQTFGDSINSVKDFPPIPYTYENKEPDSRGDGVTGYYYKLLPFDDFGSGDIFTIRDNAGDPERVLIYPFHYSNSNPDGFMGPVFGKTVDAIPGPVEGFQGDTAFVNYFLDWEMPKSEFLEGSGTLLSLPNDISHYEIWESQDNFLYFGAENKFLKEEENTSGYRKITGDLNSISHAIPIEELDPASGITNALHVLDSSALGPKTSITHKGEVNDKRYFWVRAVDHGGNKGPFTGKADMSNANNIVEGLGLVLGQQNPTDISDFEQSITQTFPTTLALVPNNPFENGAPNSPTISWNRHYLYMEGTGWVIGENDTADQYVYFKPSENGQEITAEQKLILGLAEEGEKVPLFGGEITANPSFNSFDVDNYVEISQDDIDQILPSDDPSHDPLLHRGVYVKLDGNITPSLGGLEREIKSYNPTTKVIQTYTPFVGAPAVGDEFEIVRHTPLSLDLDNPLRNIIYTGNYNTSSYHPAGVGSTNDPTDNPGSDMDSKKPNLLEDGDKIVARNSLGIAAPMWHAFANATIGTAMIEDAAIDNAKIHNLTADKIRSAVIQGQDLQVGGDGNSGQIRSVGFGVQHPGEMGFDAHAHGSGPGFVISGNGSFYFKGKDKPNDPGGRLFFEDGKLTLEGKLRQTDGKEYTFVDLDASPDSFFYTELSDGTYTPDDTNDVCDIRATFQNSFIQADEVRFRVSNPNNGYEFIKYSDFDNDLNSATYGKYDISGFTYDPSAINFVDGEPKVATAQFKVDGGFDSMINTVDPQLTTVIVSASGVNTSTERSIPINFVADGAPAVYVELTTSQQVFEYDADKKLISSTTNPTLTATAFNTDGVDIKYHFKNSGGQTLQNTDNNEFLVPSLISIAENFSDMPITFSVDIYAEDDPSDILASDRITFFGTHPGKDSYTVFLTNENHTYPANEVGDVSSVDLAGGKTQVRFFRGTEEYSYDSAGDKTFSLDGSIISSPSSSVTAKTSTETVGNLTKLFVEIDTYPDGENEGTFTIKVKDNQYSNPKVTFEKIYTYSKAIEGVHARKVDLTADQQSVTYDSAGSSILSPSANDGRIKLTAIDKNTSSSVKFKFTKESSPFGGQLKLDATTTYDGSVFSANDEVYYYPPITRAASFNSDTIKVEISEDENSVLASDVLTIYAIQDGSDVITAILSNEAHSLTKNSQGTITSTGSGTHIRVFQGAEELTFVTTAPSKNEFTVTAPTISGITGGSRSKPSNEKYCNVDDYNFSAFTGESAVVTYTITYKNSVGENGTITKQQTFSLSEQGNKGVGVVFRGIWKPNEDYIGSTELSARGDVVYYVHGGSSYWMAQADHTSSSSFENDKNAGNWESFGAEFQSVATDLLLAQDATITRTLIMGGADPGVFSGSGGEIKSSNFIGGLSPTNGGKISGGNPATIGGTTHSNESYTNAGFRFKRGKNGNDFFVVADIGGEQELEYFEFVSSSSPTNTYPQGSIVRFDGANYRKKSTGTLVGTVIAPTADTTNWEPYIGTKKINSYIRMSNSTGLIEIAGPLYDGSISSDEIMLLDSNGNFQTDDFGNILTPSDAFLASIKGNFTSFIGGGFNNKFDAEFSVGSPLAETSFSNVSCAIVAGASNEIKSKFSFIGAGFNNLCRDNFSSILGGHSNSMPNDLDPYGGSNLIGGGTYNEIDGGSNQLIGGGEHNEIDYQNSIAATHADAVPSLVMPTTAGKEQNIRAVVDPDRMIYSKYVLGNGTDDLADSGSSNWKTNSWIGELYFANTSNFNLYLHGGINPEGFGEWAFVLGFLGSAKSSFIYISPLWAGSNSWETNRALGIAASAWFYIDGGPFGGWIWSQQNLTGSGGDAGHYIYSNTKNSWVYIYSGSAEAYCYNESQTYSTW